MTRAGSSALVLVVLIAGCSGDTNKSDVGGDPNVAMGQVGNEISSPGTAVVGSSFTPLAAKMTITKNEAGIVTARLTADLTGSALAKFNALIPTAYKDGTGKVSADVKYRVTSEGIQDFWGGTPFTLVRYDAQVGDQYTGRSADGKTLTRTVTQRSTTDDFYYGLMLIKTITVEQNSLTPGIKKYVYKANHNFGIVYFEIVADDGTTGSTYVSSKY